VEEGEVVKVLKVVGGKEIATRESIEQSGRYKY
jgi:hypothetical protein